MTALDFRPHIADGFFLSPNDFTGPHQVLGMVTVSMRAEGRTSGSPGTMTYEWRATEIPIDSVIARAKAEVRQMGGDALVNLHIRATTESVGGITLPGWEITGLAIARRAPTHNEALANVVAWYLTTPHRPGRRDA